MNQKHSKENDNFSHSTSTRKDYQLARRITHLVIGILVGTIYGFYLEHQQAVYILGSSLCFIYIFEQVRINYPKIATKISPITKYIYRTEEELKESASIPMIMGILLTILSFPKSIAMVAIYTLAIADPLSALIGIRYGQHHIVKEKSIEGSLAFFVSAFVVSIFVYRSFGNSYSLSLFLYSFLYALGIAVFEMIPLRLDDNLTIPIFSAFYQSIIVLIVNIKY